MQRNELFIMSIKEEFRAWSRSITGINIFENAKDLTDMGFSILAWSIILVVLFG